MQLKHCFLYLAHFPEDYQDKSGAIVLLWAAEGIITLVVMEKQFKKSGEDYLEELVRRNMVIAGKDYSSIGSRYYCQMHDMMREICLSKAKEENFLQVMEVPTSTSTINAQTLVDLEDSLYIMWFIKGPFWISSSKGLMLAIHMPRFPDQYRFPPNLAHIRLQDCRMEEDPMPILEKLLHLKSVVIILVSSGGEWCAQKVDFPVMFSRNLQAKRVGRVDRRRRVNAMSSFFGNR
ncbi:unnamed protein product [Microthlaspi erraticum]|uniref:Disease resistance protein winged helix domain-containing protein n=1 Tax=Microthlaspi erraticum TaxID=1685480 RepID=A0A6D2I5C4_9BRAS|nr:unnamed protein product [Microthlaspi erraticum]